MGFWMEGGEGCLEGWGQRLTVGCCFPILASMKSMRMTPSIMVASVAVFSAPLHAKESFPLRNAVELTARDGLPNFLSKMRAGKPVRVAYLGGSITAAPGWRVQSRQWLQEKYPAATVEEIHAAIGGTGSDLGVFRLQADVLRHNPDLLFVEFAVNDGGAPPARIQKTMVFSSDGVHPLVETGHRVYTETIARSWPGIMAASGEAGSHKIPAPLLPDELDKREILFEKNRADFDKKPEKFEELTWYVGSLMILGDE